MMIAKIETHFRCMEGDLRERIKTTESLIWVCKPLLTFKVLQGVELDEEWEPDKDYPFRMYLFGLIPLGRHTIRLVKIDLDSNLIQSKESGLMSPVWNHDIRFNQIGADRLHYVDEIEIRAGVLTPMIWLFAHAFYRHRQRRWRKLLET